MNRDSKNTGIKLNPSFTAAVLEMEEHTELAKAVKAGTMTAETAVKLARAEDRRRAAQQASKARAEAEAARLDSVQQTANRGRAEAQARAEAEAQARAQINMCPDRLLYNLRRLARYGKMPEAATEAATITATEATARGYHVIAARLAKGTITEAEAAKLAARLDSITGSDFTSAYTAEQAIKGTVRALHSAENYSGGVDFLRQLAQQAEREAAIHAQGRPYTEHATATASTADGTEAETLPDVWDSIQESATAIVEAGTVMAANSGTPLITASRGRGENKRTVYTTATYGITHATASTAAKQFSQREAKRTAKEYLPEWQTADRPQATEQAAMLNIVLAEARAEAEAAEQAAEQAATEAERARAQAAIDRAKHRTEAAMRRLNTQTIETEARAQAATMEASTAEAVKMAARLAKSQGQFAVDVVNALVHWPQIAEAAGFGMEAAGSMPSNRLLAVAMAREAAKPYISTDTATYAATVKDATLARRIDRALQAIRKSREAATLAATLREEIAEQASGKRIIAV